MKIHEFQAKNIVSRYGVAVPKEVPVSEFLGVCPACDADVFADKPHVEVTTVFVFEDKTARTNSDYLHMNCYKFGGN